MNKRIVEPSFNLKVKNVPKGLSDFPHKEIIDIYIPKDAKHPTLRMRKKGNVFEITKKEPMKGGDASEQSEHTIHLSKEEFDALSSIDGKKVSKIRYDYMYDGLKAEVDVFQDDLEGLILVDFEFSDVKKKNSFKMPDFCLADITQNDVFAGGMICGKKYSDIKEHLDGFGYKKLTL